MSDGISVSECCCKRSDRRILFKAYALIPRIIVARKYFTHLYTLMYQIIVQQKNDLFGSLFLCYRKIYCTFIIADIYALTVLPNSLVTWYGSVHVKPSMDVAIYPVSPKAAN